MRYEVGLQGHDLMRVLYLHGFASSAHSSKATFFKKKLAGKGITALVVPDLKRGLSALTVQPDVAAEAAAPPGEIEAGEQTSGARWEESSYSAASSPCRWPFGTALEFSGWCFLRRRSGDSRATVRRGGRPRVGSTESSERKPQCDFQNSTALRPADPQSLHGLYEDSRQYNSFDAGLTLPVQRSSEPALSRAGGSGRRWSDGRLPARPSSFTCWTTTTSCTEALTTSGKKSNGFSPADPLILPRNLRAIRFHPDQIDDDMVGARPLEGLREFGRTVADDDDIRVVEHLVDRLAQQ